jgi:hypothetical protein
MFSAKRVLKTPELSTLPPLCGGSGGNSGKGGRGGLGGQVHFVSSHRDRPTDSSQFIERDCADGQNGKDGQPGRGAPGGTGGKRGQDAVLYFKPDKSWSYILKGQWRRHKGSRTDLDKIYLLNIIMGYKIREDSCPRRQRAAEGKRGNEGKIPVADHLQQREHSSRNATADVASKLDSLRQSGSDERERQLEATRYDERANETESINRIVEERNVISRHEEALAVDRQRLERLDEICLRVRSKMKETFEQRIVLQSVVGQRITRQMKRNFEDEDLGLDASGGVAITDFGRDIRSGHPVSDQPAAAIRCLAELDAWISSLMMSKDDNNKNVLPILRTVQSLVLNLNLDDHENEWNSIEKIFSEMSSDPLKLADSLKFIGSNLRLIISLSDQSPARDLIKTLERLLAPTVHDRGAATQNAICVLHEFRQRPIKVKQVIALLSRISDWTQQSNILLGLFFNEWLLSTITKTILEVSGSNEQLGRSRASLFTEVWLQCSPLSNKWTSSSLSSTAVNQWLTKVNFFLTIFKCQISSHDEILLQFARERIGIAQNLSKIDKEKRWQLFFFVDHLSPTLDELDEIGRLARKKCDRYLLARAERAFNRQFVSPIWSQIQSLLKENLPEDANSGKVNEDIREAINRLETTIRSSFTNLSFHERWELGCDLKEKLNVSPFEKELFLDWIKPQSIKASTQLFLPNKDDADDEVEIILSLLDGSNDLREKSLELHYRLSHLTDVSFKPSQIEKIAGILLNESSDHPIIDDFNNYHWQCFRSIFLENWSNYFFSHWSTCHQQTEHLRDVIVGRNSEGDDRSLNTLELALEQYLLFTTGLPPLEAIDKWRQLQNQSSLQGRIGFIAKNLKQASE